MSIHNPASVPQVGQVERGIVAAVLAMNRRITVSSLLLGGPVLAVPVPLPAITLVEPARQADYLVPPLLELLRASAVQVVDVLDLSGKVQCVDGAAVVEGLQSFGHEVQERLPALVVLADDVDLVDLLKMLRQKDIR